MVAKAPSFMDILMQVVVFLIFLSMKAFSNKFLCITIYNFILWIEVQQTVKNTKDNEGQQSLPNKQN